jgi:hypothetical protein
MPRGKAVPAEEPEQVPAEEAPAEPEQADQPEEVPAVEMDTEAPDVSADPEPVEVPATASESADLIPEFVTVGGVDLPLSPGEEIISQRTDDDAILWAVTNFGRKLRIDPEGGVEVVTGPPLDVIIPAQPKSTAVGVLTGGAPASE